MKTYREVICGYCEHRFMWEKDSPEYFERPNGQIGRQAECPKCSEKLAVFDKESVAIPVDLLGEEVKHGYEFRL